MSPRPTARHHRPGSTRLQVRSRSAEPAPREGRVVVHGWPVLVVVHDARGDWHLLADHPELSPGTPTEAAPGVGLGDLARRDPRLAELEGLPRGWIATRSTPAHTWTRRPG
jgi:hypothetical protein